METRGGSGGSWGRAWRHLGPKTAQSSKILEKVTWWTPSTGTLLGAKIGEKRDLESFFVVFFCFVWRFVFSSILGEFMLPKWCLFELLDMPQVW